MERWEKRLEELEKKMEVLEREKANAQWPDVKREIEDKLDNLYTEYNRIMDGGF